MKNSDSDGKLFSTTNYDQFVLMEENRKIIKGHLDILVESIKANNDLHLHPIIVTKEMHVIDGQHRLSAARKLDLPVYYVVDTENDPHKMIVFNSTQRSWDCVDYMHYWVTQGKEDYVHLQNFIEELGYPLTIIFRWLGNGMSAYKKFRNGTFRFKITSTYMEALLCTKKFSKFMKEKNFKPVKIHNQQAFHDACKQFFSSKLVDKERFFEKLAVIPFTLSVSVGCGEYIDQFIDIYNYHKKTKRIKIIRDGDKREISM